MDMKEKMESGALKYEDGLSELVEAITVTKDKVMVDTMVTNMMATKKAASQVKRIQNVQKKLQA